MSNRFAHLSDLLDELKPSERIALFIWIGLSAVLIFGLAAVGIPYISTFSYHSPLAIFVLLLFAPLLLIMTEKTPHEAEGMGLGYDKIALLLVLEMIGIVLALFLPLPWYSNPATFIVAFLIPLYVTLFVLKIPKDRLGFTGLDVRNVLGSLILTLAYAMLVFIAYGFNELVGGVEFFQTQHFVNPILSLSNIPLAVLYSIPVLLLLAAIPEEFMFRTLIQTNLTEKHGPLLGILASSLIFGLFHIPVNYMTYFFFNPVPADALIYALLFSFVYQAQVGLIFGIAWQRSRSLVLPVSLHLVHNMVEMAPIFLIFALGIV
ncbi:MAG: CPBP family intramembrane metalloprotease [Candidatus Thorarchaeota archaeon]|nr:CPBP family intramembrane metalloprotease [Candidatus Thorarchaeota archaeon]